MPMHSPGTAEGLKEKSFGLDASGVLRFPTDYCAVLG